MGEEEEEKIGWQPPQPYFGPKTYPRKDVYAGGVEHLTIYIYICEETEFKLNWIGSESVGGGKSHALETNDAHPKYPCVIFPQI